MPFISSTDTRWHNLLNSAAHDIYHLPGYTELEARLLKGEAIAWYDANEGNPMLIPLVRRQINGNGGLYDLVSPYGYSGILSQFEITAAEASVILGNFNREAGHAGYVTSFLRLNPLINQWQLPQTESWRQWFHGGTISVDFSNELEAIRSNYSENHKRNLRRLLTNGFYTVINTWDDMASFILSYNQTMQRRHAHPYYFFPMDYFLSLHKLLGERLILIVVKSAAGEFAAGGLFTLSGGVMQYHLGATADAFVTESPSKLMMDAAIACGKDIKAGLLHLGGGLGGSTTDGLFRFKKGFGRLYHPYTSLRFIHLPSVYEKLREQLGKGFNRNTYFPEYRSVD